MDVVRGSKKQIAVVIYPGVSALELVGTTSVLSGLGLRTGFQTVTVGKHRQSIEADSGLQLVPERTFHELSHPFGMVVPGGGMNAIEAMGDDALLAYLGAASESAELVSSVGNGALLLAAAGLLSGRRATTHWAYRQILENLGAVYIDRRWVEDGKFVTSGGTSGGIDMALDLVAKHRTQRSARHVQLWVEYDPQPPFGAIDESDRDETMLPSLLMQHRHDWEKALRHRPDVLDAVQRAMNPAIQAASR